ncbi:MAG: sulfur carrier protein ThiS [Desulfobacterales bacterium]|nr:sulfur carrier protein ThiS [Desulfobacterales bacterium]
MQIKLNGKTITTDCRFLSQVIRETESDPSSLIAEVNFEVIREPLWSETVINDGDQIELLSFVGGG